MIRSCRLEIVWLLRASAASAEISSVVLGWPAFFFGSNYILKNKLNLE